MGMWLALTMIGLGLGITASVVIDLLVFGDRRMGGKSRPYTPAPEYYHSRYQNMLPSDPETINLWDKMRGKVPKDVSFQLMHAYEPETGEHIVSVVIETPSKKRVRFSEPIQNFPSDHLITQIMLVA